MARKLRVEYAGAIYHLTMRSNGVRNLYRNVNVNRQLIINLMASPTLTPALSQREREITRVNG